MHGFVDEKANDLHAKLILPYADKVSVRTTSGPLTQGELNRRLATTATTESRQLPEEEISPTDACVEKASLAIQVYTTALDQLLTSTLPLSEDIWNWQEVYRSPAQSLYYFLQTSPRRIVPRLRSSMSRPISIFPTTFTGLLTTPVGMVRQEMHQHIKALDSLRDHRASALGSLAAVWPMRETTPLVSPEATMEVADHLIQATEKALLDALPWTTIPGQNLVSSLDRTMALLSAYSEECRQLHKPHALPSGLLRWWIPVVGGTVVLFTTGKGVWNRWHDLVHWIHEARLTLMAFAHDYLVEPVRGIYKTIRYKERRLAVTGEKSLSSDTDSLERMVLAYAQEQRRLTDTEVAALAEQVRVGDLGPILRAYEEEMKTPIKSLLFDSLMRILLIQVQKTKVDMDLAMAALDQLLRSNELNFSVLALLPSLLGVWAVGTWVKGAWSRRRGMGAGQAREEACAVLRRVERLLNLRRPHPTLPTTEQGRLLCDVYLVRQHLVALSHGKRPKMRELLQDLREVEDPNLTVRVRLGSLERIWRIVS
ncbi:ATP synthase regulation protein NCA2-domain-containing protein [Piptocephalis cylindrospora]|uniref:ATP synthase regulation protein NCA2-domain-containing protein n=1 Tax=Piptocephalis cylindrospora TaxID=1907219 RepID=A0A4P9Y713_9FUNG|nr:ATP synthase regulation protein NCA2-domain-containing protein [Piptocephalis cylindrospora]|eukprot:RKP14783.1 ATP synthase regulation protein NCA2-domain-containing protein [Piptocephalis cylindrospora]